MRRHQVAHKVESWALAHHPTIPGLCVSGDERGVAVAAGLGWAGGWLGRSENLGNHQDLADDLIGILIPFLPAATKTLENYYV